MYHSSPPAVSEVWLCEIPFITIIASSVETYKKECCGLLLGYRSWSHWDKTRRALVEQAYQFQTSERSRDSVTVPRQESKCKDMIYILSMMDPLGYFHSHPEDYPSPSDDDIEIMRPNEIEIIVSVERKGRAVPWSYDSAKKTLSGVLGEFRFEICAYIRAKRGLPKVNKIDLLCPFALGIGSKYFDTQVRPPKL